MKKANLFETTTFGVEIETIFRSREACAVVIQKTLSREFGREARIRSGIGSYDRSDITAPDGRVWKVMSDGSVSGRLTDESCEVVTPILKGYKDMQLLKAIVTDLQAAGVYVNGTCGVHVHVGKDGHTAKTIRNLVNIIAAKEDFLQQSLRITEERLGYWALPVEPTFLKELNQKRPKEVDEIAPLYYRYCGRECHRPYITAANWEERCKTQHYDPARYRLLNLHAIWYRGTIEFRAFNGTIDAARIEAYVTLCLAINAKSIEARSCSPKKNDSENRAYAYRCWLLQLGFIGAEYSKTRNILMEAMPGNAAWRHEAATTRQSYEG